MKNKVKSRTETVLVIMNVLAWVAFIGLLIKLGSILISYGVSWVNPEAARNLYKKLNLHELREYSFWHYSVAVSFTVAIWSTKAYIASIAINILSKINLANPFTIEVSKKLDNISYSLLGIWITSTLANGHNAWLSKSTGIQGTDFTSGELIFMAGLVFIITQVFKRGVELQSENDLTV